ncbi:MAG TPA: hypothetical protein VL946_06715, partial [Lacibacter sp.]|nr:hypothetical protein [Lacibacter sp.]
MKTNIVRLIGFVLLFTAQPIITHAQKKLKLVWADEFNKSGLPDPAKWSYDLGRGCPDNCGWGNNELQY